MNKQSFAVTGMHCASCASVIGRTLKRLPGVHEAEASYATEKVQIQYDAATVTFDAMDQALMPLGYRLQDETEKWGHAAEKKDSSAAQEGFSAETIFIVPVAFFFFVLMLWDIAARVFLNVPNLPFSMELLNIVSLIVATLTLFWVGQPFLRAVVRSIRYRVANMDTLIGMGTLAAYVYSALLTLFPDFREWLRAPESTYFDATIVVIGFVTLGKYLEARSKKKTGEAIEKLIGLQAKTATLLRDGKEETVPIERVQIGDILIVKPGTKIPVDGIIVEGKTTIDESMVTGEPLPVERTVDENVIGGTMNRLGGFRMKATKIGKETFLSQIIRMVEEAQGSHAPIEKLVDRVSSIFVPVVMIIAVLSFGFWLLIGSQTLPLIDAFSFGLMAFVGVLVIACPCALGLATPTAVIVGVGRGAREGILIKDAATLEELGRVTTVVLDKTGTLTMGRPALSFIHDLAGVGNEKILQIAASLEQFSEHPIAMAIREAAQQQHVDLFTASNFVALEGRGVEAMLDGTLYRAGNLRAMKEQGIEVDETLITSRTENGGTPVFVSEGKNVLGFLVVADTLKQNASQAIQSLRELGMKPILLSGDDERTAQYIAKAVGITEVVAGVLPEGKRTFVRSLKERGERVAMVGDGINDAPALAEAQVGVAMATGTDIAMETAGITLLHGDLVKLVRAVRLSRATMRTIRQNLFWAFLYNVMGIPLAAGALYPFTGWLLSPVFAGLAMAFSSVSVVSNALRLKIVKI